MTQELGDRMKGYEASFRQLLPNRLPVIIRIDGSSFSKWTKGLTRPFDPLFADAMNRTAMYVAKELQGTQLVYIQSDEISFLLTNDQTHETKPAFGNSLNKLVSLSASKAGAFLTSISHELFGSTKLAAFDSRVFVIPESDVCNYYLDRQIDAIRNSIFSMASCLFSNKELFKKSSAEQKKMILAKGQDWDQTSIAQQRGRCLIKRLQTCTRKEKDQVIEFQRSVWEVDDQIPIFSQDRNYVEQWL